METVTPSAESLLNAVSTALAKAESPSAALQDLIVYENALSASLEHSRAPQVARKMADDLTATSATETTAWDAITRMLAADWVAAACTLRVLQSALAFSPHSDSNSNSERRFVGSLYLLERLAGSPILLSTLVSGERTGAAFLSGLSAPACARLVLALPDLVANACARRRLDVQAVHFLDIPPSLRLNTLVPAIIQSVCAALLEAATKALPQSGVSAASAPVVGSALGHALLGIPQDCDVGDDSGHTGSTQVDSALQISVAHTAAFVLHLARLGHAPALLSAWVQTATSHVGFEAVLMIAAGSKVSNESEHPAGSEDAATEATRRKNGLLRATAAAAVGCILCHLLLNSESPGLPISAQPAAVAACIMEAVADRALDFVGATPHGYRVCPDHVSEGAFSRAYVGLLLCSVGRLEGLPGSLVAQWQWLMWAATGQGARVRAWPGFLQRSTLAYLLFPLVNTISGELRPDPNSSADIRARALYGYTMSVADIETDAKDANAAFMSLADIETDAKDANAAFFSARFPLLSCARAWSSSAFIAGVPSESQAACTRLLAQALRLAPLSLVSTDAATPVLIIQGVQSRLDVSDERMRSQGMLLARIVSERMTPGNPLRLDADSDGKEGSAEPEGEEQAVAAVLSLESQCGHDMGIKAAFHDARSRGAKEAVDSSTQGAGETHPDPMLFATSSSQEISTENRSRIAEPHPLALARARIAARAPTSLAQAYAMLVKLGQEDEVDPDGATALFATLGGLIRACALSETGQASVLEYGIPIMRTLLGAENRYAMPGFEAWRFSAIAAVTVCIPPLAVPFLLSVYSAPSWETSDSTRLEALDTLVAVSRELTGRDEPPVCPPPPWLEGHWYPEAVDDLGNEFPVYARPASSAENALSAASDVISRPTRLPDLISDELCDTLFNPLLSCIIAQSGGPHVESVPKLIGLDDDIAKKMRPGGDAMSERQMAPPRLLMEGNELLLAQSMRALAVIAESVGSSCPQEDLRRMWSGLACLAWLMRESPDSGVRCAALSATAAAIATLHKAGRVGLSWPSVLSQLGQRGTRTDSITGMDMNRALQGEDGEESRGTDGLPAMLKLSLSGRGRGRVAESMMGTHGTTLSSLSSVSSAAELREGLTTALRVASGKSVYAQDPGDAASGLLHIVSGLNNDAGPSLTPPDGGPTAWDDLVDVAAWIRYVADREPNAEGRAVAGSMLRNAILRKLVLDEDE